MRTITKAIAAFLLVAGGSLSAQMPTPKFEVIPAPAEAEAVPLYGDRTPGAAATENWSLWDDKHYVVRNVTRPTLTAFLPEPSKATGASVLVAPGGGFMLLAMGPEGWNVGKALAERGITAFVLKYRIKPTPTDEGEAFTFMNQKIKEGLPDPAKQPTLQHSPSTDDAVAALALIRQNAEKYGIDPRRVGMIGFSAGAMTALNTVMAAPEGARPDFFGYIYGPQAAVAVPSNAPPMFAAIAFDDPLFPTMGFPVVEAWQQAKRPVELHAYGRGGHGFNLGLEGTTTTLMLDQFVAWMDMQGFLKPKADQ
ncbi:alpha/beta hydrolase fold family protein (plasmid) [Blastomonas sp. RAC04]|uniref:alpha/beta hydrolase n=1 Tax=Blastomonas sp. RAC04 TaxID=1842535 RepID=UPI00083D11D9|nr:alpha/beta hydrolase [Blastomonas sp. RAC04]AOF98751.1 alpha/beta hydrolase fold family protein [Blastomonas sp. RAC04]